jgi:6-pyruvoyltetrahydropterin/6-carboxytetrahydropterin synthase
MRTYYRFKFYLNARHSVTFGEKESNIHPHTWEIVVRFGCQENSVINFTEFERELEAEFLDYEGKYLNELPDFKGENPTMECLGKVFYKRIKSIVNNRNMMFKYFEISENPTRTYIIEED